MSNLSENIDKKRILDRIKEIKGFNTDAQLAEFLGISRPVLSNWYKRGQWIFLSCCQNVNIWI